MFKKKFLVGILSTILVLPLAPVSQSQAASGLLTAILCPGSVAIVFYGSASNAPREGANSQLTEVIFDFDSSTGWDGSNKVGISLGATGACGIGDFNTFSSSGVVTQALLDEVETDSGYQMSGYPYADLGIKVGSTRYSLINSPSGFFNMSPGLFLVNYGTGGGSLSSGDGYSSDGTFISRIYPVELPQISVSNGKVSCSTGQFREENLNEGNEVSSAEFRISLHSESGELLNVTTKESSASFETSLLPKKVMIWCEVKVAAGSKVALSKSTDDFQALNNLKFERKLKLKELRLAVMKREVADIEAASQQIESDYQDKLAFRKFAIVLP